MLTQHWSSLLMSKQIVQFLSKTESYFKLKKIKQVEFFAIKRTPFLIQNYTKINLMSEDEVNHYFLVNIRKLPTRLL